MKNSRRSWLQKFFGLLTAGSFWHSLNGQTSPAITCSGTISDPSGKGIEGVIVRIYASNGEILPESKTSRTGDFILRSLPNNGTYTLVFRDEGNLKKHPLDVRELTTGKEQRLSLTFPQPKTFAAGYAMIQATESLSVLVSANPQSDVARALPARMAEDIWRELYTTIEQIELTPAQKNFLQEKIRNCAQLLAALQRPATG